MDWSLVVAVIAVVATITSAIRSSVRNEAHHLATVIQGILNEISELTNGKFETFSNCEAVGNLKCDLLESALQLLVRRCATRILFDGNVKQFEADFIGHLSDLRNELASTNNSDPTRAFYRTNAKVKEMYTLLNSFIGERFRPLFESRD